MRAVCFAALSVAMACVQIAGATFGKVVVVGGHAADIALDEQRHQLYVANFAGRRIDVMATGDNTLRTPIPLGTAGESGSLALSPDNRYLVVANYADCTTVPATIGCAYLSGGNSPSLTVIDLGGDNVPRTWPIPQPVVSGSATPPPRIPLAVEFGAGSQAFLVTSSALFLVDVTTAPPTFLQLLTPPVSITSAPLPVSFGEYPPQIIQASSTVSGDRQTIFVLAQGTQPVAATATTPATNGSQLLIRYNIPAGILDAASITSSPALGPRVVSANMDGSNILAGWSLLNEQIVLLAQFPYPTGVLNLGGHAWDYSRNMIYAQIPSGGPTAQPVLHVVDTDNLTVRERIQLPENLGGKTVFASDMNTLYAISDSGVTVLPVGSLAGSHRVSTSEEQLLFQATSCDNAPITQTLDVIDLGGGATDFTLSIPPDVKGVSFSQQSGTTPAKVVVTVMPSAFRGITGTTAVPVTIQSAGSIGIPNSIRLLINTKDPDQRGVIHSLAGTIVDIATDVSRGVIYALRQDRNQVIVLNGTSLTPLAVFRTGNTPTKMTFSRDGNYLIVGNDNSQIANVFDLNQLQPTQFIVFPPGHYPRSIAASNGAMFAIARNAGAPPGQIDQIDFANRVASTPATLGIYTNSVPPDSVMTASPSGGSIFTAMADGTVLLYDDTYSAFEASRKDLSSLGGSYAAISDDVFLAGGLLFNRSMVQIGPLAGATAASSVLINGSDAVTINAGSAASAGSVERVTALSNPVSSGRSIEAPVTKTILSTPPPGQTGQTILSFLNTTARSNSGSILYLSISGFTELPSGFDAPVPLPSVFSLVNSADGGLVAPGSLITIGGSNLSTSSGSASGLPLPTTLGEICVSANNIAIPLLRVSQAEIDAQLPYEVTGTASLVVVAPGGKSAPFSFTALETAPAVFRNGQAGDFSGLPLIYRAFNNQLVDFTNPIHPDDTLMIFATGLGQTSPAATSGAAAPSNPLEIALSAPTISLGGTVLSVEFAGLAPGMVGVYQINAGVPHAIRSGAQMPLNIQQGTLSTTFTVRVVNP